MQHSRHIGKIVLSFAADFDPPSDRPARPRPLSLDATGSYLVTGGLSGFGLRTAQWLAQKGARHLVLLSRTGAATPESQAAIAQFEQAGVSATAVACDVTDRQALASVLRKIEAEGPPLRGVVHAAMVIDDGLIRSMKAEQLEKVLAPKILGALNLDALTRASALDFFVLYSSATTLFGNPGQGNYVAANMFLEAMAERRRAEGLPATCAAWGPIADAGYLARNEQVRDALLARMGGTALGAEQALDVLERLLATGENNAGVLDLDWGALSRFLPSAGRPKFSDLARRSRRDALGADDIQDLRRWLDGLPPDKLVPALTDILRKEIGEILRIPPEKVEPHRSVYDLGMDSLMGVELVTAVEGRIGVTLPLMALSEGPTIDRLVERIVHQLRPAAATEEPETAQQTLSAQVQRIAEQHAAELGQEEVAAFAADLASTEVQAAALTPGATR
jgi:NAD(P)-dependent dehydrogenase (short-subunit alcohol dehydrogenase family)/acyl carrier protein